MKKLIEMREQYLTLDSSEKDDEEEFEWGVSSKNHLGQELISSFYISSYDSTVLLFKSLDSDEKFYQALKNTEGRLFFVSYFKIPFNNFFFFFFS